MIPKKPYTFTQICLTPRAGNTFFASDKIVWTQIYSRSTAENIPATRLHILCSRLQMLPFCRVRTCTSSSYRSSFMTHDSWLMTRDQTDHTANDKRLTGTPSTVAKTSILSTRTTPAGQNSEYHNESISMILVPWAKARSEGLVYL